MRRNELESTSIKSDFIFLSDKVDVGHLGLIDDNGYPRIIPVNFIAIGFDIYFHGSLSGEKYELMKNNPKASFSVYLPYSFIPSHWLSDKYACPASHFFKSFFIRGKASIISDLNEKARVLQKLMSKYQPQGGYTPIENITLYKNALEKVGVYKIKMSELSIKIKFGQNESSNIINKIIGGLKQRGSTIDLLSLNEILKLHPLLQ